MYTPEHWSGSCQTCRTGSYGPGEMGKVTSLQVESTLVLCYTLCLKKTSRVLSAITLSNHNQFSKF